MFRADLLKEWRMENKLSQAAAAQLLNVTQSFWRCLEIGNKNPSIETLILISKTTGISCDELLSNPISPRRRRARRGEERKAS